MFSVQDQKFPNTFNIWQLPVCSKHRAMDTYLYNFVLIILTKTFIDDWSDIYDLPPNVQCSHLGCKSL